MNDLCAVRGGAWLLQRPPCSRTRVVRRASINQHSMRPRHPRCGEPLGSPNPRLARGLMSAASCLRCQSNKNTGSTTNTRYKGRATCTRAKSRSSHQPTKNSTPTTVPSIHTKRDSPPKRKASKNVTLHPHPTKMRFSFGSFLFSEKKRTTVSTGLPAGLPSLPQGPGSCGAGHRS